MKSINIKSTIFYCILGIFWLITRLPYSMVLLLGKILGYIGYLCMPKARIISKLNLDVCLPSLPEKERQKLVKTSFLSIGMGIMETMVAWLVADKNLPTISKLEGYEEFKKCIDSQEGIIMLGVHQASAELAGRLFRLTHAYSAVYQKISDATLDRLVLGQRSKVYSNVIANSNVRKMVKLLKAGETIWFAPDQAPNKRHRVFVPFFNQNTATSTSTSTLAKLGNAAVFPVSCYRDKNNSYYLTIHPRLKNFPSDSPEQDALVINQILEKIITKNPEQHLWQYKRFKVTEDGSAHIYDKALKK